MSLKVTKVPEVQDYKKQGSYDLLFGLQTSQSEWILPIYGKYATTGSAISSIRLRKLDINKNLLSTEFLVTNLIVYDSESKQYLIDKTKDVEFEDGIYEIEFLNLDSETFLTEPFLVDSDVNTPWLLEDNVWNDNGIWNDSKVWID